MTSEQTTRGTHNSCEKDYFVLSVTELDNLVYENLLKIGAARKPQKGETSYVITDKEKALSTKVLPRVLNPLGKKGWKLVAVNKMECYIFEKILPRQEVEYKVLTPPDLDKAAMKKLHEQGHLKFAGFEGEVPKMELSASGDVTIQTVLPQVLKDYIQEGWELSAISGPQLYFFTRNL